MVRIVGDTTSCLPLQQATSLGIDYFPQIIVIGDDSWRDDTEITPAEFLWQQKTSPVLPKTAAPPPALYTPLFKELADTGDQGLVITPSGKMSGTHRSAETALADTPGADVVLLDSQIIAGGLASLLLEANRLVKTGHSRESIISAITNLASRNRTFFVVDTLEYLFKGGRIGAASALFGSLLQIKPILTIQDGQVAPFDKQRTQKNALARLENLVLSECPRGTQSMLSIMHGGNRKIADTLVDHLATPLGLRSAEIPVYDLTAAILTHAGPGVVVVSYFVNP